MSTSNRQPAMTNISHHPLFEIETSGKFPLNWGYLFKKTSVTTFDPPPNVKRIIYLQLHEPDAWCGMVYAETIGLDGVE